MFRNLFIANEKYPVRECVNFSSPIQMELSLKATVFSDSFVPSLEFTSDFKDFEKKDDRHSFFISEITDCERFR